MNTKLSGAQLVLVPITRVGKNYFPLVENIRNRYVKYIDFHAAPYLPDTTAPGLTSTGSMFVTLLNEFGNEELITRLPLERLDYATTLGVRQLIGYKISLENCYIDCGDEANVGKTAAFLVWYDLPEFSKRNSTDDLITDNVTVPLVTSIRYSPFPDENRMVNKRFRRILVSTPGTTPDLYTGIQSTQLPNIYVTLKKGAYNVVENAPLSIFVQLKMLQKTEFQNIIFDFNNSYLTIGGQGTLPNVETDYVGKSVFLNLQYEK